MKGIRLYATTATVAIMSSWASGALAQDTSSDDPLLEEITVTGTLIQRSNYQLTSPIDVVDRSQLEASAPLNIAEFVRDLPYNFGSAFASGRAFGNEAGAGTINLRGLGASATLVLINGRRQTNIPDLPDYVVDVNSLMPEIMLERIEVLKDGASATYGSDAIAGVANFISRDNFEGLEVSGRYNQFTYSDANDYRIETLWGSSLGERTHIVAAFSIYDQDPINSYAFDTPGQDPSTAAWGPGEQGQPGIRFSSGSGAPGEFAILRRDAMGNLLSPDSGANYTSNIVDPECGNIASSIPAIGRTAAPSAAEAMDCRYNFWADNGSQSDIRRYQTFARVTSELTDRINFDGEFGYSYFESATQYTAGETIGGGITIPGHNPGNIYDFARAQDANGNPLYAVSSGISAGWERDGQEVFIPMRDAQGDVVLTDDPTNSASGIPFYEDLFYNGRLLTSQGGLPTDNAREPGEYAASRPSVSKSHIFRVAGGLSADLGNSWNARLGTTYSRYHFREDGTVGNGLMNQLRYSLEGLGGINCDPAADAPGVGGCEYFNPFGNSVFASADSAQANSQEVVDYIFPKFNDIYVSTAMATDLVVAGEVFELPAGPLAVALGYQNRRSSLEIDYDISANTNNRTNGVVAQDFDESRSINAFFGETNVPVFNGDIGYLELTGALRYEDLGGGLDTTDPKIGFLYASNNDLVTVRGSYGTSFIAPTLYRLYSVSASGAAFNDCVPDPAIPQSSVCTGEQNLRILEYENGNPDLEPETSKAWSFGATVEPTSNLTFEATYWRFDFDNKIATQSTTSIVSPENPNGTPLNPVVRDPSGRVISVTTRYFNQASVTTDGLDFMVNYGRDLGDMGFLNLNLAGTYVFKYEVQDSPTSTPYDAAGQTNDRRTAPANSDLRINARATWNYGDHALTGMLRYYDSLTFTLDPGVSISSWTPVDLTYSYALDVGGTESKLQVGAVNVFNEAAPAVPFPGFQPFIPSLHDTRGRSVWVKATVSY